MKKIQEEHEVDVNKINKSRTNNKSENFKKRCWFCGYEHYIDDRTKCPAYGKKCNICHRDHHFASVCKKQLKPRNKIYNVTKGEEVNENENNDEDNLYLSE